MSDHSERERDEQRKKELIELKKIQHGQMENIYAEQKASEPPPPPMTTAQKISDFWYHHKFKIIGTVCALAIISYLIVDLYTRPQYDDIIVLGTSQQISMYQEMYESAANTVAYDYNGDGTVKIGVSIINIVPQGSRNDSNEYAISNKAKLLGMLVTGEQMLYLVDDAAYEHIKTADESVFLDLSKLYPNNKNVKGDRYYIAGSEFEKLLDIDVSNIPEDLSFCIRDFDLLSESGKEKYEDNYKNSLDFLDRIIKYKPGGDKDNS